MVETFLIDTPVMITFGLLFAPYVKGREWEKPCLSMAFILGLIFATVFVISVIISYKIAPDWMWMYFPNDPSISILGGIFILSLLYYFPYIGGFLWGMFLYANSILMYWLVIIYFLAMEGIVIGLLFKRYFFVGTRTDFLSGKAVPLPNSSVAPVLNWFSVGLLILFIIFWWILRKYKRSETSGAES